MSSILVGSAPDSWGVWFPDDPDQTPYTRFLDEVADSGYRWIELGPYGYLPTDPQKLSDELVSSESTRTPTISSRTDWRRCGSSAVSTPPISAWCSSRATRSTWEIGRAHV